MARKICLFGANILMGAKYAKSFLGPCEADRGNLGHRLSVKLASLAREKGGKKWCRWGSNAKNNPIPNHATLHSRGSKDELRVIISETIEFGPKS